MISRVSIQNYRGLAWEQDCGGPIVRLPSTGHLEALLFGMGKDYVLDRAIHNHVHRSPVTDDFSVLLHIPERVVGRKGEQEVVDGDIVKRHVVSQIFGQVEYHSIWRTPARFTGTRLRLMNAEPKLLAPLCDLWSRIFFGTNHPFSSSSLGTAPIYSTSSGLRPVDLCVLSPQGKILSRVDDLDADLLDLIFVAASTLFDPLDFLVIDRPDLHISNPIILPLYLQFLAEQVKHQVFIT